MAYTLNLPDLEAQLQGDTTNSTLVADAAAANPELYKLMEQEATTYLETSAVLHQEASTPALTQPNVTVPTTPTAATTPVATQPTAGSSTGGSSTPNAALQSATTPANTALPGVLQTTTQLDPGNSVMYFNDGVASYSSDGRDDGYGRLSRFVAADPDYESGNLVAYMRLVAAVSDASATKPYTNNDITQAFNDITGINGNPGSTTTQGGAGAPSNGINSPLSTQTLQLLQNSLTNTLMKYTKFMITGIQHSRREKTQIIPTFGDTYSAIFTGAEPQVVTFTMNLVCDHVGDMTNLVTAKGNAVTNLATANAAGTTTNTATASQMTWYHALYNAYLYFLRASRLAKWWLQLRIEVPGFSSYQGYILSMDDAINANDDEMVQVSFSMLLSQPNVAVAGLGLNPLTANTSNTIPTGKSAAAIAAANAPVLPSAAQSAGQIAAAAINAASKTPSAVATAIANLQTAANITNSLTAYQKNIATSMSVYNSSNGTNKLTVLANIMQQTNAVVTTTQGYTNLITGSVLGQSTTLPTTTGNPIPISTSGPGKFLA